MPETVATHFERQLQRLRSDLLRLGALVESACQLAYGALIERNLLSVEQLIQREQDINRSAQELNRQAIALLTLQAAVAEDLRFLVMLSHFCRDLALIGDDALEIGRAAQTLLRYPPPPYLEDVRLMFERAQLLLSAALSAIANFDPEAGVALANCDDAVDADYQRLYGRLCAPLNPQEPVELRLILLLLIRNLERIGDHATTISQRVRFIVRGEGL
ncbi:phosphate transport system regulatory protein phoU-like protein [Thermosynechococcus sp. NK55a]|uniref:phosphate signaling complex protein PhoU n=1 Tax=unclassified Thermosynechococcus TaxID=2622553 RepID=UPI0003D7F2DA|nr:MULTISPECIES: phosphate signaling complex protein PhoU [unclassified Thermosynechococcus]AHB87976.1 phosphate transport system regulatory protein phoU-like protein [Thermosynechococcus sp. NK55a]RMH64113.1 MAG: phosphate signaling complex protein PhoU [Cyanobacteria bacterium J003]HIK23748.1 phosphate signaling complex protein PhoU [Thermosynechococcus sp. M3746_W2019_013]